MTEQEHGLILRLLQEVDGKVDGINTRLDCQNGRVRKCEDTLAVLRFMVYTGGGGLVSVVAYLIYMHMAR